MDREWKWTDYLKLWMCILLAGTLAIIAFLASGQYLLFKPDIAARNLRNYNHCQAAVIVVNRVCDTAEKIMLQPVSERDVAMDELRKVIEDK